MQRTASTPAFPDAPTLEKLISAAVAAPSLHNTQPWRFRFRPETNTVEIRAALERALRQEDPAGRSLLVSVGAAVLNLRLAVRHFGWEPVLRLLPRPAEPDLLASVRLAGAGHPPGPGDEQLYEAVWRRHTSRRPFAARRIPTEVLIDFAEAAHTEGVTLYVPDHEETRRLLSLTAEGERRNTADPERLAESRRWIGTSRNQSTGLPAEALGPLDAAGHVPMRDFAGLRPPTRTPAAVFEREPQLAILTTAHDRRADWLRTGMAMERVLLTATRHGVQSSPLHQALEWPDLHWALRDPRRGLEHVQMLLRLGYGEPGPATPRLAAAEVLQPSTGTA
jgi:nitroreductase